ncbi:MAG: bifunctional pyr operon transcriptional regulator/uracil phosphoribosyltransferase PyrR [Oleiphilaceae bacterium]|nr:bifunctional pyr operon transcriptional regulator/uracil phosphoribosyltransferase PyrR [Oleiphilaceae bacterium]
MTEIDVQQCLQRLSGQLRQELGASPEPPLMVGIRTGGVWLARQLHQALELPEPLGELDISFYRDDFSRAGLNPRVSPSSLPFATEGRRVLLVDDIIMSGRTIRAAMNELFDYGRPEIIRLVTLVDLGGRELPIQPDYTGERLNLERHQRLKLRGPAPLWLERVGV